MSIEERVKALEDQWQALAKVFLAPPTASTATTYKAVNPKITAILKELPNAITINLQADEQGIHTLKRLDPEDFKQICASVEKQGGKWSKIHGFWEVPT